MSQSNNPYLLTLPELMSAKKKLGRAAAYYDSYKMSMNGFDSRALNPTEFRSQLRSNFLVELTNAELGAIIMLFDKDGDGTVDTVEFMNEFFKLGKAETIKLNMKKKDKEEKIVQHNQKISKVKQAKIDALIKSRTASTFTEEDRVAAVKKIAHAALVHDPNSTELREFNICKYMTTTQFREQLKQNLCVNLTPQEVCAIMHMLDENNNGRIDTRLFVYHFFRMGRNERDHHLHQHMEITHQKAEAAQKRIDDIRDRYGQLILAKISPASEADRLSAERKIRKAAAYYQIDKCFAVSINKCFESESLTPTDFREILKNNFNVILTPGELDAVMTMFDLDGDGTISCVEFLTTFFLIGSKEKTNVLEEHHSEIERRAKAEEERVAKKKQMTEELNKTKVKWPVLPPDETQFNTSQMNTGIHSRDAEDSFGVVNTGSTNNKSATSSYFITQSFESDSLHRPATLSAPNIASSSMFPPINQSIGDTSGALPVKQSRLRKPSVIEMIAPNRAALKLARQSKSLTKLYPKASVDTKRFILEIEESERQIQDMQSDYSRIYLGKYKGHNRRGGHGGTDIMTSSGKKRKKGKGSQNLQDSNGNDSIDDNLMMNMRYEGRGVGSSNRWMNNLGELVEGGDDDGENDHPNGYSNNTNYNDTGRNSTANENSLENMNNWGATGALLPNDNIYIEEDNNNNGNAINNSNYSYVVPPRMISSSGSSSGTSDRCDSRGGTRTGATRIPTMTRNSNTNDINDVNNNNNTYGSKNNLNSSSVSTVEYEYESEFDNTGVNSGENNNVNVEDSIVEDDI